MAQVPGTNVPVGASSDEDIGIYPGGGNRPELEFEVARSVPAPSTSDDSPINPVFSGPATTTVTASTMWDQQAAIASANFMPLLAIQDTGNVGYMGSGINILDASTDISNLSSKEQFRAVNVNNPAFGFTTTGEVLAEYVRGFTGTKPDPVSNNILMNQTVPSAPAWTGGAGTGWGLDLWGDEG